MTENVEPSTFTIFMHLRTTPAWLALAPAERFAFLSDVVIPVLRRHDEVRLRYFDAEFFSASVTDVAMWETESLAHYQALVEELRETPFWDGYFTVEQIIPAVENAFARHYGVDVL
jgi:Darcynin, domain of unknown function